MLGDALAAARGGEGRVVVVSGPAGIGKTRLCREIAVQAQALGFAVAWGSCWPDGGAPPLWPWRAVLAGLGDDGAALLAVDRGGPTIDSERFARFALISDHLAAACARSPVLVVIDDIHAADPGAVVLARFVARMLARAPLVLLLASRSVATTATAVDTGWDIGSEATVIPLGPFDLAETQDFLRSSGETAVDEGALRALHRLTGGHPLHLQRVVVDGPDAAEDPAARPMADGIRAAIARAVRRLGAEARSVLSRAAVLGSAPVIAEVAMIAGVPPAVVRAAVTEASAAGLVDAEDPGRFSFSHELVRDVLQERLDPEQRVQAHAAAAEALETAGPVGPDRLTRHAHHAVQAAARSAADASRAVASCRRAAAALVACFAYEQASSVLAAAMAAHERAALPEPLADLLVERAEAVLRCGRLAEARRLFERAYTAATDERDPVLIARAALGLGGVWVNEHRGRLEWERVVGLQRMALDGLPLGEERLRHRLLVRLAVEGVYRGGPIEPALAALDQARRLGDGHVLAEALSLCHHALLTPGHTRTRLGMAEELIGAASAAGDGMLALVGLCWRTVDAFHVGDPRAERSLAELRDRADVVGCLSVRYIAEAIGVMLLIRAGRLDEAEAAAYACLELGNEVGDADAVGFLGAHLTTIRWLQARDAEMLDVVAQIAGSPTLNPAEFAFQATVASLAARAGRLDDARTALDRLTAPGLAALPESSTWLAGMLAIVEAARVLADADLARQAYDLLTPYADLPIMPSLAVTCFGSVERVLGLAALTFGAIDRAVAHLDRAVTANRLLGNRPFTAVTMAELADVLVIRNGPGERDRAVRLLGLARAEAEAMNLAARGAAWSSRLDELVEQEASIRREGRLWTVAVGELRATVPDRVGMQYLARLLTRPGQRIGALALTGVDSERRLGAIRQPVLDDEARAAYRRRVRQLSAELAAATGARADALRAELEALLDELRRSTGKGGRPRHFADSGERARTAVRKAIKRAIDEIAAVEPDLAALLRSTVTTGATCCYTPARTRPVRWTYVVADGGQAPAAADGRRRDR
jgi:tetratricopeptide (TPR) repeat protein